MGIDCTGQPGAADRILEAVWLVYPALRRVEVHNAAGARRISEPEFIQELEIFAGFTFSLSLAALFDDIFKQ